ncbi:MAG: glutaminyl-peptide cyclotransferase [Acidobacteriota bacterium]|nr:glutaminyl-peptide cyclotransferase [Acidobacteriota bacterium]NLT32479.1 glutaminyl-peptide cyclotransferase [Acidobacteriota bacterium]
MKKNAARKKRRNLWPRVASATALCALSLAAAMAPGKKPQASASLSYRVTARYPHDPGAFTQGLVYLDGFLYESTGQYGESTLRKVEISTGRVLRKKALGRDYFGEGLAERAGLLYQLTWHEKIGFIYAIEDFSRIGSFAYQTEGWGLAHDGRRLVMSDGSHTLSFLDPKTFEPVERLPVLYRGTPVARLNELEVVRGEIWANVWLTDRIARIDPATGFVTGWLDLSALYPQQERTREADVMNGIAFDETGNRLFVTGKYWPWLFELSLSF